MKIRITFGYPFSIWEKNTNEKFENPTINQSIKEILSLLCGWVYTFNTVFPGENLVIANTL